MHLGWSSSGPNCHCSLAAAVAACHIDYLIVVVVVAVAAQSMEIELAVRYVPFVVAHIHPIAVANFDVACSVAAVVVVVATDEQHVVTVEDDSIVSHWHFGSLDAQSIDLTRQ